MTEEIVPGAAEAAPSARAVLSSALRLHQAGRLDEASDLYRQVLERAPDDADALHLFGLLAHHRGDPGGAVEHIGRALSLAPDNPMCHNDMAMAMGALGRLEEAVGHLERALELRPDWAEALNNLGNALSELGRGPAAIEHYQKALAARPDFAEAHNNLGAAFASAGRALEAEAHYRRAVAVRPGYAEAHTNLGKLLERLDRHVEAVGQYIEALVADPGSAEARTGLVWNLRDARLDAYRPEFDQLLLDCLASDQVRHDELAVIVARHLRLKHGLDDGGDDGGADGADADVPAALAGDPLFLRFLEVCVNVDPRLELCLTRLRRRLLFELRGAAAADAATLALLGAMLRQSANNEHVWAGDEEEDAAVAALKAEVEAAALAQPSPEAQFKLLLLGLYLPLDSLSCEAAMAAAPLDAWLAPLRPVIEDAIHDRREEERLAAEIPAVAGIDDATSREVRAQYEANPYPRWRVAPFRDRENLAEVLTRDYPHLAPPAFLSGPLDVLVAGCGTGQHPIVSVALSYANVQVTAVDLSRASLAYGLRMARKLGVDNISFAQCDILQLPRLERRFHVIEAVGVLHHMAEPLAGWRGLTEMLEPGGLMLVGLYRARAGEAIAAARARIAELGLEPTAAGIRAIRRLVLEGPRDGETWPLTEFHDFYSTSECRDMLVHVQDRRYELPEIGRALDELGLRFIGFAHESPATARAYKSAHPDDAAMTDLAAWDAFEAEHPYAFHGMYEFWCQKPAAADDGG